MAKTAALRRRLTHAALASVGIFALAITYWGIDTFQQSEASVTTTRTTINFEEYTAPRLLGTQSVYEYATQGVLFTNDSGQSNATTALSREGAQCNGGVVYTGEQLATSGSNRLHPYPSVSSPLVITFTENRVTSDVSFQILGVGDSKNVVEFFDNAGKLLDTKEYVNTGAGVGCDKKQLASLTKPNIAKIRITQPQNANGDDGLAIDDLSFAPLTQPINFGTLTVQPTTGAAPLAVTATHVLATTNTATSSGADTTSTATAITRVWDFGDGSEKITGTTNSQTHQYTKDGTYTVTLNVDGQEVGRQTVVVAPTQQDPSVTLTVSKATFKPGETVQLTFRNGGPGSINLSSGAPFDIRNNAGSVVFSPLSTQTVSTLTAGQSTSWTWNQRDDNDKQVADNTYLVTVRYSANGQQKTKQASFVVAKDATPTPAFDGSFTISPTSGVLPLSTTFTCESKNNTTLNDLILDWGDGAVVQNTVCPSTLTHTYTAQGEYTVKVSQGDKLLGSQKITANAPIVDNDDGKSDGKSAPKTLASTGANLLALLMIAGIVSAVVSYFILRRPFHGTDEK